MLPVLNAADGVPQRKLGSVSGRIPVIRCVALCFAVLIPQISVDGGDWPQNSGPHGNWSTTEKAPVEWSVVAGRNVVWETELPEGGQSSVTVWKDRCFLTCHAELKSSDETMTSKDIVGYCLDAATGKILWTVDLPGRVAVGTAGIFSDATVFAPVTDGEHVWFFNRSGGMMCCDFEGRTIWKRFFVPRNRHTNRQAEPILVGDQIIVMEVLDKEAGARIRRHAAIPDDIDPQSVWTYLHGIDKKNGSVLWTESVGTACHTTPVTGRMANGEMAVVHARGGGHGPLERPYGLSLTSLVPGREGRTLWSTELPGVNPAWQCHWTPESVVGFHRLDHVVLDTVTGHEKMRRSLVRDVTVHRIAKDGWTKETHVDYPAARKHANTNQANILAGDWHYFLAHDRYAIGRVHIKDGRVEYLEVPVQVDVEADGSSRWILNAKEALPIETTNSRGLNIAPDKRAQKSGWGHVSAASPVLAGKYLYFPVMTGTVYVVDTAATEFNGEALVAVNDLGPAGRTWTLSSFSCSDESLFIRTMKSVIRIGEANQSAVRTR